MRPMRRATAQKRRSRPDARRLTDCRGGAGHAPPSGPVSTGHEHERSPRRSRKGASGVGSVTPSRTSRTSPCIAGCLTVVRPTAGNVSQPATASAESATGTWFARQMFLTATSTAVAAGGSSGFPSGHLAAPAPTAMPSDVGNASVGATDSVISSPATGSTKRRSRSCSRARVGSVRSASCVARSTWTTTTRPVRCGGCSASPATRRSATSATTRRCCGERLATWSGARVSLPARHATRRRGRPSSTGRRATSPPASRTLSGSGSPRRRAAPRPDRLRQ